MEVQQQPAVQQSNGMAVSALVLGIVGLVIGLIPFLGWFLLPAWILAIVFGAIGLKKEQSRAMCLTGIILGVGTFVYKIGFLILIAIGASAGSL